MGKLRNDFSKKAWQECCTSMCDDCTIAEKYRAEYGKKEGRKKMEKDKKKRLND